MSTIVMWLKTVGGLLWTWQWIISTIIGSSRTLLYGAKYIYNNITTSIIQRFDSIVDIHSAYRNTSRHENRKFIIVISTEIAFWCYHDPIHIFTIYFPKTSFNIIPRLATTRPPLDLQDYPLSAVHNILLKIMVMVMMVTIFFAEILK
jgi:hypothetical protein